jgi:single-stranded DNA-binding protein
LTSTPRFFARTRLSRTGAAETAALWTNTVLCAEWHRVVAFGWRASVASHCHKGERVYVEGYVRTRKYEKEEGEGYVKEIVAQLLYPIRTIPRADPAERPATAPPASSAAHPSGGQTTSPAREGALY